LSYTRFAGHFYRLAAGSAQAGAAGRRPGSRRQPAAPGADRRSVRNRRRIRRFACRANGTNYYI